MDLRVPSNQTLYQTQLKLLLLINQDFKLEEIINAFLPPALSILNCDSGHIWLFNKDGISTPKLFSAPHALSNQPAHLTAAIEELLAKHRKNQNCLTELFYLPTAEGLHNYFFPLAEEGIFLLQSSLAHIPETLAALLQPVIDKLAKTCAFCLQYQLSQQKFSKIFEESPVSLWEQDLSATEAALKNLKHQGITDIRKYLIANQHLPIEILRKLKVIDVNKATLNLYGANSKEEFFKRAGEVYDADIESRDGLFDAAEAIISGKKEFSFEAVTKTFDHKKLNVIVRSVVYTGEHGYSHVFSSVQDITEQKQAAARYEYLATHDALTELPNRRFYETFLKQSLAEAQQNSNLLALFYVDIDYFKKINDSYGHHIGDSLLQTFANKLKSLFPNEFVARLGGDEFAVILKKIDTVAAAGEIADNIKKQLDTSYQTSDHQIDVVISIGIAVYPLAGEDFVNLNKNADIALYSVKNSGRNNYKYFAPDDKYCGLINLATELTLATEQQQIFLCYQPIYALDQAAVVGLEALARWQHPKFGLIMPKVFISIAEDNGSIISMGYWIIEEACRQYVQWFPQVQQKNAVKLKINISPKQLTHRKFFNTVCEIINRTKINPQNLEFELTETALIQQPKLTAKVLQQINSLGITLSLDDIGMGYSSLSYLGKLPINTIKIDQSFVRGIPTNDKNMAIIKAILQMAHNLQLSVIVEGVENRTQVDLLTDIGCNMFQGYYFYKPLKAADVKTMLKLEHLI